MVDGFDVCQGVPVDVMHIVCEGALPYTIKGLISHLVATRIVSVTQLNSLIQGFRYIGQDKKNAPSAMEKTCFTGLDTGKIGQSGE